MLLQRLLPRLLPAALAISTLVVDVHAQTPLQQCNTGTVPLQNTGWTQNIAIPRFDPNLGVLVGVTYSLSTHIQGIAKFESLDKAPVLVTLTFSAIVTLKRPDMSLLLPPLTPSQMFQQTAAAFDGTVDFRGPSGATFPNVAANDSVSGQS